MARFHWLYDEDLEDLDQRSRQDTLREAFAKEIQPGIGDRVAELTTWYPWLSPGAVSALAKMNVTADSKPAREVANLEVERRTAQQDWMFPGDDYKQAGGPTTVQLFGGVTSGSEETPPAEEEG